MARYYEESALLDFVKKYTPTIGGETTMECVERAIRNSPTADVVPRAEVKRLQSQVNRLKKYDEERDIALHARLIANTRQEVARKVIEEIFLRIREEFSISELGKSALNQLEAELKKKYTGEE